MTTPEFEDLFKLATKYRIILDADTFERLSLATRHEWADEMATDLEAKIKAYDPDFWEDFINWLRGLPMIKPRDFDETVIFGVMYELQNYPTFIEL